MKKLILLSTFSGILFFNEAFAQTVRRCANDEITQKMMEKYPEFEEVLSNKKQFVKNVISSKENNHTQYKTTGSVTVPIVFHIVLTQAQLDQIGGDTNMAKRVDSQMAVLNRDFNKGNADSVGIPAVFKPLYGDAQIKFGLAHTAPNGTSTPGYEIHITSKLGFSVYTGTAGSTDFASDAKYASSDGADAWDASRYLNVWVVNFLEGGLLGVAPPPSFAQPPSTFPLRETGAAINYQVFGKSGPGQGGFFSGYNGGRTLVHELGHYFELFHIWGNTQPGTGNCSDDDGIGDTPQQEKDNSNCPSLPKPNCTNSPGGEMFMNYMDYVLDACYKMFTNEQAALMNADVSTPQGYAYGLSQHPELLNFPTSVANIKNENAFQIFPNPTTGQFQININDKEEIQQINVMNMLGQTVHTIRINNRQIKNYSVDLASISKGVYTVQCIFAGGALTKKIILQ